MVELWRKTRAFARRDLILDLSYRMWMLTETAGVVAQLLIFFFLARLVGPGGALSGYGGAYFPFVLVGIAFSGYQAAALNGFSESIHQEQGEGTLEAVLLTPTSLKTVLAAGALRALIWTTVRLAGTLAAGAWLLGADLSRMNFFAAGLAAGLTFAALAGLGLASAAFLLVYKRGSPVNAFLNGASRLLAGVYFPIEVLPEPVQAAAAWLPLTHGLEAMRRAALLGQGAGEIGRELGLLALFAVILVPSGLFILRRAERRAKLEGSLAFR